jgi:hypothetical protein
MKKTPKRCMQVALYNRGIVYPLDGYRYDAIDFQDNWVLSSIDGNADNLTATLCALGYQRKNIGHMMNWAKQAI